MMLHLYGEFVSKHFFFYLSNEYKETLVTLVSLLMAFLINFEPDIYLFCCLVRYMVML